ncbi:pathogenesis-related protein PR-4-like [Vicia villosa]|uniref:pathogenesis-related protein PR-4-like n=1 Tax=Vicia villosa TaxID=3911 RepID=UPI00273A9D14|nr:pathogenesis-related protein PR-4-like [Vicia villosa]
MWKLFLVEVLILCAIALASAQSGNNVRATYESYNPQKSKWDMNTLNVFCAAQDASKSLAWRSKYDWAAFCAPIWPFGKAVCGNCLNVTNSENGKMVSRTVRIVDKCTNGGLVLDIGVFRKLDSSGIGFTRGYLMVDYQFVNCVCSDGTHDCQSATTSILLSSTPTAAPTQSPTSSTPTLVPITIGMYFILLLIQI